MIRFYAISGDHQKDLGVSDDEVPALERAAGVAVGAARDWHAVSGQPVRLYALSGDGRAASLLIGQRAANTEVGSLLSDLLAPRRTTR